MRGNIIYLSTFGAQNIKYRSLIKNNCITYFFNTTLSRLNSHCIIVGRYFLYNTNATIIQTANHKIQLKLYRSIFHLHEKKQKIVKERIITC